MRAFALRPVDVLAAARRIAAATNRPDISRQQLTRIRFEEASASEEKIFIVVAALRELTGWVIGAGDLFDVEPALPRDAAGSLPSLSPRSAGPFTDWRSRVDEPHPPGDDGVEALYTEYGMVLRAIATRRYAIPADDAEALVHDAFVAYLERKTSIRDVKGWLVGTVRNECRHYWRDRGREEPLLPEHEQTEDPLAEGLLQQSLGRIEMATVIAQLGERCRETLRRFYWKEESTRDIAETLSTSQNNVLQLLFTCRRRVGDLLRKMTERRR